MLIALTGKKRSGKTSVANALMERGFKKVNFKTALLNQSKIHFPDFLAKEALVYGTDVDQLLEDKPGNVREFLQNYGTDLFRKQDKDYWVNRWKDSITDEDIVVDDLRFVNEAIAVKELGGTIIRIVRPSLGNNVDSHQSEIEMDLINPDYIVSDDDIDEVIRQINEFIPTPA